MLKQMAVKCNPWSWSRYAPDDPRYRCYTTAWGTEILVYNVVLWDHGLLWGTSSARNTLSCSVTHLSATPAGSSRLLSTSSLSLSDSLFSTCPMSQENCHTVLLRRPTELLRMSCVTFHYFPNYCMITIKDIIRLKEYRRIVPCPHDEHADFQVALCSRARVIWVI